MVYEVLHTLNWSMEHGRQHEMKMQFWAFPGFVLARLEWNLLFLYFSEIAVHGSRERWCLVWFWTRARRARWCWWKIQAKSVCYQSILQVCQVLHSVPRCFSHQRPLELSTSYLSVGFAWVRLTFHPCSLATILPHWTEWFNYSFSSLSSSRLGRKAIAHFLGNDGNVLLHSFKAYRFLLATFNPRSARSRRLFLLILSSLRCTMNCLWCSKVRQRLPGGETSQVTQSHPTQDSH